MPLSLKTDSLLASDSTQANGQDFLSLLKPGVMSLVVFTGFVGALLAPGTLHPYQFGVGLSAIALGSGAAAVLNMWYDRDIDGLMTRTKNRPIPAKKIAPHDALAFGVVLSFFSILLLGFATNWVAGLLLASAIFFYVGVYTIWLKRKTVQNIVIGGVAGALPPLIGWTMVTGSFDVEPFLYFLIIFIWTPSHFWSLALYRSEEYAKVKIPMLPVLAGSKKTKRYIFGYTLALIAVSLLPWGWRSLGTSYGSAALGLGSMYGWRAWALFSDSTEKASLKLFGFSIIYLFALFLSMLGDRTFKIEWIFGF